MTETSYYHWQTKKSTSAKISPANRYQQEIHSLPQEMFLKLNTQMFEYIYLLQLWFYISHVLKAFFNNRWRTVGRNRNKTINVGQAKKSKHHEDVLSLRNLFIVKQTSKTLDERRIPESHVGFGKRNTGKFCFKNQSEKINISPNLNKSSQSEMLFYLSNKRFSEDSLKISKNHRLCHFGKLSRKHVFETTWKTTRSLEAKKSPKIFSSSFSSNSNLQCNLHTASFLQTFHSSPLSKRATKDIPESNSLENSGKRSNSVQNDEVPWRNSQSYSSKHHECGYCKENKLSHAEGDENLADESLLCLKRGRKPAPKSTSLLNTTREKSDEKGRFRPVGQGLMRKLLSIKHTKPALDTKLFNGYQCKKTL